MKKLLVADARKSVHASDDSPDRTIHAAERICHEVEVAHVAVFEYSPLHARLI